MKRLLGAALAAACLAGPALAGDISVADPFARATPPGAGASAAYMAVRNAGSEDDRLVAARSDVARRVELHTHILDADGVARMREVEGGIPLPAGETVTLAPGGLHVMLMGLTGQLLEGESVPLTLVFEKAGELALEAPVRSLARPMEGEAHGHGAHGHGAPKP
ncbi:MAG: copper chaperone PCu(A)C [Rubrimonas sp.]